MITVISPLLRGKGEMHFENVEITIKILPKIIYIPGMPLQSVYSI